MNGLHRPLPVRDAGRLVVLATRHQAAAAGMEGIEYRFTYPALADFRNQARSFSDLIGFNMGHAGLSAGDKPRQFFFCYGIACVWVLARLMNQWLYGTIQADPAAFVVTSAFLAALALWACYVPARRAMRLNPLSALRHE